MSLSTQRYNTCKLLWYVVQQFILLRFEGYFSCVQKTLIVFSFFLFNLLMYLQNFLQCNKHKTLFMQNRFVVNLFASFPRSSLKAKIVAIYKIENKMQILPKWLFDTTNLVYLILDRIIGKGVVSETHGDIIPNECLMNFMASKLSRPKFPCEFMKDTMRNNKFGCAKVPRAKNVNIVLKYHQLLHQ